MKKEYLGDGVYAELDSWNSLILTTEDGFGPSNRIVLDPQVIAALNHYLEHRRQEIHQQQHGPREESP